jgi:hypothetical protein
MVCEHTCECKKLVTKINLFKPHYIEEISGFMQSCDNICEQHAADYYKMEHLKVVWGTRSDTYVIHREVATQIVQKVIPYMPF